MPYPVIDLHCDLLSYLNNAPYPDPMRPDDIGCSLPALQAGHVAVQVCAIYTPVQKGSSSMGVSQSRLFEPLLTKYDALLEKVTPDNIDRLAASGKVGLLAAVENASSFCEEDEALDAGFKRLEQIISHTGRILYISMTHHTENRFGGGNYSKAGLKDDGKVLLDYISGRHIAIDFSHTSDALARGILEHVSKHGLDIPVLASHSNYRSVFDHPRNLPDEIAREITGRGGIIGVNFLRAFLNNDDPDVLYDHIRYGLELGGADAISLGADFFFTGEHPDQSRVPFYHPVHENATCYPALLAEVSTRFSSALAEKLSHQNALHFIKRVWL